MVERYLKRVEESFGRIISTVLSLVACISSPQEKTKTKSASMVFMRTLLLPCCLLLGVSTTGYVTDLVKHVCNTFIMPHIFECGQGQSKGPL
jgi:hypothetical protein